MSFMLKDLESFTLPEGATPATPESGKRGRRKYNFGWGTAGTFSLPEEDASTPEEYWAKLAEKHFAYEGKGEFHPNTLVFINHDTGAPIPIQCSVFGSLAQTGVTNLTPLEKEIKSLYPDDGSLLSDEELAFFLRGKTFRATDEDCRKLPNRGYALRIHAI